VLTKGISAIFTDQPAPLNRCSLHVSNIMDKTASRSYNDMTMYLKHKYLQYLTDSTPQNLAHFSTLTHFSGYVWPRTQTSFNATWRTIS